jgi:alpha-amylase/alpha-mannosidase (GH57 family)
VTTERSVCIHGHFYQPPRENPWLESIELQDSAYPFHDWNERIAAECYAANATSRILDEDGRIRRIVSNYERMSFNVGPTLMAWMEYAAPATYAEILDSDRRGRQRFDGHGPAIAQVYGHLIMPLASSRDKRTQIRWGVVDFERRFGRPPEGMWLAETAVDLETLDLMAAEGIEFTILEPHQASAIRPVGSKEWIDVSGGRIDPTRPYLVKLSRGRSIAVFIYDRPASQAIAFEGLLNDGDRFADRLLDLFDGRDEPQIVNVAADGETYGHHQRHGDMALAWTLERLDTSDDVGLTVYGKWLADHPPTHEVAIVEDTAWSCVHGVGRWHTDCGCSSGMHPGWHQRWRQPLRDALDWLRDTVAPEFERQGAGLFVDPWAARDGYIDVILDRSDDAVRTFLTAHAIDKDRIADEMVRMLQMMELQRHAMLMFTSCGWFFDELSGIETVQVIHYASRVIQLAHQALGLDLESAFVDRLAKAESNLPDLDGAAVYRLFVAPARVDLPTVVAHYAMTSLFDDHPEQTRIHAFDIERHDQHQGQSGRWTVAVGQARVTSRITRECEELSYGVLHFGDHNLTGGVHAGGDDDDYRAMVKAVFSAFDTADLPSTLREMDRFFQSQPYSLATLFRDDQRRIVAQIIAETVDEVADQTRSLYEDKVPLLRFLASIGVPIPDELRSTARLVLNHELSRLLADPELDTEAAALLLADARSLGIGIDREGLGFTLAHTIEGAMAAWQEDPQRFEHLDRVAQLIDLTTGSELHVELGETQNRFYRLKEEVLPAMARRTTAPARRWVARFREIGADLGVRVD